LLQYLIVDEPTNGLRRLRQGGFLIAKVHQVSGRVFARLLKRHRIEGLSSAQGRILFALWQRDDVPISDLVRRTALEKSTLTSMLDSLEQAGHVLRVPSTRDRRQTLVRLTDSQQTMRAAYERVSLEMTDLFYRGFDDEEIDRFEHDLGRILANLVEAERHEKEPTT
jgi:DNA-binding MarR family transcriptional regulator